MEPDEPTTEPTEAERLRRERFDAIGKLPMDYRTYLVVLDPAGNITIQADGLTYYEMMGIHEFARARLQNMMLLQQMSVGPSEPEDDAESRLM